MKKSTLVCLLVGASLILTGCVLFGGTLMVLKGGSLPMFMETYQTNTYEIEEEYQDIWIHSETADVKLVPSEDGKTSVVCYEKENLHYSVSVKDGVLTVTTIDTRKWYDHLQVLSFDTPKVTVYLPEEARVALTVRNSTGRVMIPEELSFERIEVSLSTGDVFCSASALQGIKIKSTTGNISVDNVSATTMGLQTSTGKIKASSIDCTEELSVILTTGKASLTDVKCGSLISRGSTGDLLLTNVIADGKMDIVRDTGDVSFEACDAAELFVKTDTGDVEGSLRTEKIFFASSDTGDVEVPRSTVGGVCEIISDTGDVKLRVGA